MNFFIDFLGRGRSKFLIWETKKGRVNRRQFLRTGFFFFFFLLFALLFLVDHFITEPNISLQPTSKRSVCH